MSEPAPPQAIRWSGTTHVGRLRKNNEDAFLALTFDANGISFLGKEGDANFNGGDFVFAVSDGMGGAHSGEFASRIAVDRITHLFPASFRLGAQSLESGCQDFLMELLHEIHGEMIRFGRAYEECAGMGATLTLCWFRPDRVWFAHIGDSRIYYLPVQGEMTQLTHDHTYAGWLQRQGKLNEREVRNHPRRHALSQALGAGNQFLDPQIGAIRCQPGDKKLLLCTDGLSDGLWDRQIAEFLREPGDAPPAARLVHAAVENSGRDNCTAVVVEFD